MNDMKCTTFITEEIQNQRIAVIGDVMVDRYFYGEVKRISPEAPVPVNRVKKVNSVLGGARTSRATVASAIQATTSARRAPDLLRYRARYRSAMPSLNWRRSCR